MSFWTTTLAIVAGLCFAVGLLEVFFGVRQRRHSVRHFAFALFALFYGGAVLAARAGYLAGSGEEHIAAARATAVFASMAFVALLWFVAALTRIRPVWLLGTLTGLLAVAAVLSLVLPDQVVGNAESVSALELPWGEVVLTASGEEAALVPAITLIQLVGLGYVVFATVRQFRRGEQSEAGFLAIGISWLVFTLIVDFLVSAGLFEFVFLSDVGFVGFVVTMSLSLAQSTIDTERDLLAYQSNLKAMVEDRTAELRVAQAELLEQAAREAADDARTRIAHELHDQVTQTLFSVNLIAASLPRLWRDDPDQAARSTHELKRLTRGAMAEMRTLLRELRPHTIVETDLDTLLSQLVEGLATRYDLDSDVSTRLNGRLSRDVHVSLYRIAQEAVTNIAKHADASRVEVLLEGDREHIVLRIRDDGRGFDPEAAVNGSMGIGIMRERASTIGAQLTVETGTGSGTSIAVEWPSEGGVRP